jgi:uncharacterized protein YbaA (DUF1428 family)
MTYVEGFLVAVPTANKEKYRAHAESAVPLFKKLGATRLVECWGDDVQDGKVTDFRRAVKAKDDESVVFSWIEYPDKETRNAANDKMQNDPDAMAGMAEMPFDAKRMIFSGFAPILQAGSDSGMGYVDGYVIPVEVSKQADYQAVAEAAAPVFMDHGAQAVVETWGEDLMHGEVTDFYRAVEATDDENIVFSWIAWPSKAARDKGNATTMADDRFKPGAGPGMPGDMPMPFDGKRMIMGGFVPIVDQNTGEG